MNDDDFERRLAPGEHYHNLKVLEGLHVIIRVDGRSFTRLTESYEKPFDPRFHLFMVTAARTLLKGVCGVYAYTESDEISVLLPQNELLFDGEVEKLVSISAGVASAAFYGAMIRNSAPVPLDVPPHFDARVWLSADFGRVVDYFRWRQADAARCALNGYCYWKLRQSGKSASEASNALERKGKDFKNELLFQMGINFNDTPLWQRRGTGIRQVVKEREGFNPKTGEKAVALRSEIAVDEELPMGDEYSAYIRSLRVSDP